MSCHLLSREKACRKRRPNSRVIPVYPYIRTTVLNYSQVYVKFIVQFGFGVETAANRSAWLDACVGPVGSPVLIRLERLGRTPYQKAVVQTIAAELGRGVAAIAPLTFSANNDFTGGTFSFGCLESGTGTLLWSLPGACGPTMTDTNLLLNPINRGATYLQTGISNTPSSAMNGRALRALPTQDDTVFELAWKPVASTDGYPISLVNLIYTQGCLPCGGDQSEEFC